MESRNTLHTLACGSRARQRARFMRALLAILSVILFGTFGLSAIEGWSGWQSLYFTLITITTVGYGDMGLSEVGQKFTTIILVLGIATTTYAFGQLVQAAIAYQLDWRFRMQKRIEELSGHSIVCGAGRCGRAACEKLRQEGRPVVLIDLDAAHLDWCRELEIPFVLGCATEDETLRSAGIERAHGVICATDSDAENIMTCLTSRELNRNVVVVSRASQRESIGKLERAGASHVIAPAVESGRELASTIVRPHVSRFLRESYAAESRFRMTAVPIEAETPAQGLTTRQLGDQEPNVVFVAIQKPGQEMEIRPMADDPLDAGDLLIVLGDPEAVARLTEWTAHSKAIEA